MSSQLICVDRNNKPAGYADWKACHGLKPKLHLGFTVLIFNKNNELLLQKRSKLKPLWPDFWDGTSSHPNKGDSFICAGERRLKEEMGFTCRLKKTNQFIYKAKYKNLGWEWEVCAILEGKYDGKVKPDPKEVGNYKWASINNLKKEIKLKPEIYAPWLRIIIGKDVL